MFIKTKSLAYFYLFMIILISQVNAQGLVGTYYGTRSFDGPPLVTRTDPQIAFDWMNTAPDPAMMVDNFSIRWQGTITANVTGNYVIGMRSDDGCRIWIDDRLLVDAWKESAPTLFSGMMRLVSGRATSIMVEYFEATGGATATLLAGLEGQPLTTISADWLTPNLILPQGLPKVGVFSNDRRATEGRDRLSFTVYRIGGLGTALTARISFGDGVQAGVDYVPFNQEITIPANLSAVSINVTPMNDDLFNGLRALNLVVLASDSYSRITDQPLVLEIVDDEREIAEAYTIAGEIQSDIPIVGNLVLEVTPVVAGELVLDQQQLFTFVPSVSYSTPRLAAGEYELWSFADHNENGRRDMDELQGFWTDGSVRTRVTLPPDRFDSHVRFKFLMDDMSILDQMLVDQGMALDLNLTDMEVIAQMDAQMTVNDIRLEDQILEADMLVQDQGNTMPAPIDQGRTENTSQASSSGCQQASHQAPLFILLFLGYLFTLLSRSKKYRF